MDSNRVVKDRGRAPTGRNGRHIQTGDIQTSVKTAK